MPIWERAVWAGPPDSNHGGAMVEVRGLVEHIAEGSYAGTIAWQKNSVSDVSSHFVIDYDGTVAQMLDTDVTAWTQAAGNGHWVSAEFAGFHTDSYTPEQQETASHLYAWLVEVHDVPLQLTDSPSGYGWGWHGMGGAAWGDHPDCPGPANVALRSSMLARTVQILEGGPSPTPPVMIGDFDMWLVQSGVGEPSARATYLCPGGLSASGRIPLFPLIGGADGRMAGVPIQQLPAGVSPESTGIFDLNPQPWPGDAGGSDTGGASIGQIAAAMRTELDRTQFLARFAETPTP